MAKECLWYNGELSCYELLDFDPNGMHKEEIIEEAKARLILKGINFKDLDKALETLYLIDVDDLKRVV